MPSSQSSEKVEVRESKIKEDGLDIVRRRYNSSKFDNIEEFPAHIPVGYEEQLLRDLADHVDGREVVSSDRAEKLRQIENVIQE